VRWLKTCCHSKQAFGKWFNTSWKIKYCIASQDEATI
jgi:hypothetical protein